MPAQPVQRLSKLLQEFEAQLSADFPAQPCVDLAPLEVAMAMGSSRSVASAGLAAYSACPGAVAEPEVEEDAGTGEDPGTGLKPDHPLGDLVGREGLPEDLPV